MNRVRGLTAVADRVLARLRDELTPGQRWTLVLGLVLTLLVLLFGLPKHVVVTGR